jgi:excisionase family DNA binding protein
MTPNTNREPAAGPESISRDLVFTVREVAERLKISQWTVNKLIREHSLGSIQIGARRLVPSIDLEEYLRGLRMTEKGVRYGN